MVAITAMSSLNGKYDLMPCEHYIVVKNTPLGVILEVVHVVNSPSLSKLNPSLGMQTYLFTGAD